MRLCESHSEIAKAEINPLRVTRRSPPGKAVYAQNTMAESTRRRARNPDAGHGPIPEVALIQRIKSGSAKTGTGVRVGIGDDCAVLRVKAGEEMVVTTDLFLEGRHFRRDWNSPELAGHRCLARGLSDIAAMGARPVAAFLSLALPGDYSLGWVDGFLRGFHALAECFAVQLAGGDTGQAAGGEILADIVLVGAVAKGRALLRSGARPGDGIYASGRLGGAAAELRALGERRSKSRRDKFSEILPEPRIALGRALVSRRLASACMDLSDGLSSDLGHLCEASGLGAHLEGEALPIAHHASLQDALHGGEDYELLFTSSRKIPRTLTGVAVTRIGSMRAGRSVMLDGMPLEPGGWEHFKR